MKLKQTKVQERLLEVISRIKKQIEKGSEFEVAEYGAAFEQMLSDLNGNDFFGTEGQNDPRGDFRDGEWSMDRVQGIDK